ncbi:MAG: hypothetical protein V2G48_06385 [bacterium JZ-2024 1]
MRVGRGKQQIAHFSAGKKGESSAHNAAPEGKNCGFRGIGSTEGKWIFAWKFQNYGYGHFL